MWSLDIPFALSVNKFSKKHVCKHCMYHYNSFSAGVGNSNILPCVLLLPISLFFCNLSMPIVRRNVLTTYPIACTTVLLQVDGKVVIKI